MHFDYCYADNFLLDKDKDYFIPDLLISIENTKHFPKELINEVNILSVGSIGPNGETSMFVTNERRCKVCESGGLAVECWRPSCRAVKLSSCCQTVDTRERA